MDSVVSMFSVIHPDTVKLCSKCDFSEDACFIRPEGSAGDHRVTQRVSHYRFLTSSLRVSGEARALKIQRENLAAFTRDWTLCRCPVLTFIWFPSNNWEPVRLLAPAAVSYFPGHLWGASDKVAKPTHWESKCLSFHCCIWPGPGLHTVRHQPVAPTDPTGGPCRGLSYLFHLLFISRGCVFVTFKQIKSKLFSLIFRAVCVSYKNEYSNFCYDSKKCTPWIPPSRDNLGI